MDISRVSQRYGKMKPDPYLHYMRGVKLEAKQKRKDGRGFISRSNLFFILFFVYFAVLLLVATHGGLDVGVRVVE